MRYQTFFNSVTDEAFQAWQPWDQGPVWRDEVSLPGNVGGASRAFSSAGPMQAASWLAGRAANPPASPF